ncbi:MAG: DUF1772 domain-containing protein [Terracidiphilus sp.]
MISFLSIAAVVSIGLMIGVEFAVWVFINPILWKLDDQPRAQAVQLFARKLGTAMPFWYALNLLFLIAESVVLRHEWEASLLVAAAAIWTAVIILTLIFLVPINNRLAGEQAHESPAQAQREHKRWDSMHRARVVALGAAMVLFLAAVHY